jgi:nucleoside-diphosphate-sugar epimerase
MIRPAGLPGPVVITGAAGFVGANLAARAVELGAPVHLIVRPGSDVARLDALRSRCTVHEADLAEPGAVAAVMASASPVVVFHAAKHSGHPSRMNHAAAYRTNVLGARAVLEALPKDARLVALGSSLEYGPGEGPLRETQTSRPDTVHGVTKAAATELCLHFARTRGTAVACLRLFSVYGPWEAPERFLPTLLRAAVTGGPFALTPPGVMHDWVHVDDVVDACVLAATNSAVVGQVVNVGTGRETSNEDVVLMVERLLGRAVLRDEKPYPPAPYDRASWVADTEKARQLLDWSAATTLEEGIRRTIDWHRDA